MKYMTIKHEEDGGTAASWQEIQNPWRNPLCFAMFVTKEGMNQSPVSK